MPEGVSVQSISLLGKARDFRASLKTLRTVRKETGHNLLSPQAGEVISENLDEIVPAIIFFGTQDHEGFDTLDALMDQLSIADIMQLTPVVFGALGLKVDAEKN